MFRDILVPIDLNAPAMWERALQTAVEIASLEGGRLHLMSVIPEFGLPVVGQYFPADYEKRVRDDILAKLEAIAREQIPEGVDVGLIVAQGSVWREIVREAREREVDLVIMGSHRPGVEDYVLGANATRVAQRAPCSVLIVRS